MSQLPKVSALTIYWISRYYRRLLKNDWTVCIMLSSVIHGSLPLLDPCKLNLANEEWGEKQGRIRPREYVQTGAEQGVFGAREAARSCPPVSVSICRSSRPLVFHHFVHLRLFLLPALLLLFGKTGKFLLNSITRCLCIKYRAIWVAFAAFWGVVGCNFCFSCFYYVGQCECELHLWLSC